MYPGWMVLSESDPITDPAAVIDEIVNNSRAYAYASQTGLCWLQQCLDCPETQVVVPGGSSGYTSPKLDPAPWFDPDNVDTEGFLGVIGLDITGDESSTRNVTVSNSVTSGGVIGPPYFGPRTLVLHGIAIAEDECSLQAGLNWLEFRSANTGNPCIGDRLTFFDCCPCICEDDQPGGPCWAANYGELSDGPTACTPSWWPVTYNELTTGPPPDDPDWCAWPDIIGDLKEGPPGWSCCVENCVVPYLRHYNNAAITQGPLVLRHPVMFSGGAMVEFELTLVAADPQKYGQNVVRATLDANGTDPVVDELPGPSDTPDPFSIPGVTTMKTIAGLLTRPKAPVMAGIPTSWVRDEAVWADNPNGHTGSGVRPSYELQTFASPAGFVRIGLWHGGIRFGGYLLPFIPANTHISINGPERTAVAVTEGVERSLINFVRDYGGGALRWPELPETDYTVTIDQENGHAVRIVADAASVAVG